MAKLHIYRAPVPATLDDSIMALNRFDEAEQLRKDAVHALLQERMEVDHSSGCWVYTGAWEQNGQAKMRVGRKVYGVHKVAAWIYVPGFELWDSTRVVHTCQTPACFNPAHLAILEGQAEALQYQSDRGRLGEQHRKLSRAKAKLIRARAPEVGEEQLAQDLGVSLASIKAVLAGRTWIERGGDDGLGGSGEDAGPRLAREGREGPAEEPETLSFRLPGHAVGRHDDDAG